MSTRGYKEFPANIKNMVWTIYPDKDQIVVNGFKHYSLKELKGLDLNIRLSLPQAIFVAIDKA